MTMKKGFKPQTSEPFNYAAAEILEAKGIKLASISCQYNNALRATTFTVQAVDGKIGSFAVDALQFGHAHVTDTLKDLLMPYFEQMEFHEPIISELQSSDATPTGSADNAGTPKVAANEAGSADQAADPASSTEAQAVAEGV